MAQTDENLFGAATPGKACEAKPSSAPMLARLRRYFAKRGAPEADLDDMVQDVFLRLVRRGRAPSLDQLDGYIVQTAQSVLIDRWRAQRSRKLNDHVLFEPDRHGQIEPGADEALLAREALRHSGLILLELPERCRTVFVLRRLEGLSFAQIARRLEISVSTAEKDMLAAVRHLAARMEVLR